jgi:hypothetical protein
MSSDQAPAGTVKVPVKLDDNTRNIVYTEMEECDQYTLASILKELCEENPYLFTRIRKVLNGRSSAETTFRPLHPSLYSPPEAYAPRTTSLKRKELNDVTDDVSLPSTKKSKSEKFEDASSTHAMCKNCNALFKHADNEMGDCVYHEGKSSRSSHPSSRHFHRCIAS